MTGTEFKEFLLQLDPDSIIEDEFTDGVGRCCVVGHYIRLHSENPDDYSLQNCSDNKLDSPIRNIGENLGIDLVKINNNRFFGDIKFGGTTPYERLMAAADYLIEQGV